jgi:hypothetical protein
MSTIDLIANIKKSSKKMSQSQRKTRLIEAHIIKNNGEYDPKYFSAETVQTSKRIVASIKA